MFNSITHTNLEPGNLLTCWEWRKETAGILNVCRADCEGIHKSVAITLFGISHLLADIIIIALHIVYSL